MQGTWENGRFVLASTKDEQMRYKREAEHENERPCVTPQHLADTLVAAGVIHPHAIEDREGYDNFRTWDAVIRAAIILSNVRDQGSAPCTNAANQERQSNEN
jgi:hypothetical protein